MLTDLRNSFATSVDTNAGNTATSGRFVGSAGNMAPKPFKAKALDLSCEKFFSGNKGYVSVAGFYKKLDTYITTSTNIAYDFTTYARQLGLVIPQRGPPGTFTKTVNGNGGNFSGVQALRRGIGGVVAAEPGDVGAGWLRRHGQLFEHQQCGEAAQPDRPEPEPAGHVQRPDHALARPVEDQHQADGVLRGLRLQRLRGTDQAATHVASVANDAVGGYPTLRYIEGSSWLSAQIGYEVESGMFKGLGVRMEGNNLNNPVYRQLKNRRHGRQRNQDQRVGGAEGELRTAIGHPHAANPLLEYLGKGVSCVWAKLVWCAVSSVCKAWISTNFARWSSSAATPPAE